MDYLPRTLKLLDICCTCEHELAGATAVFFTTLGIVAMFTLNCACALFIFYSESAYLTGFLALQVFRSYVSVHVP